MGYVQVIFSPTGGTRRAAEIITSEWSNSVETIDLSAPAGDYSKCILNNHRPGRTDRLSLQSCSILT